MVIEDASGVPLPGNSAEFRSAMVELAVYNDQRWPTAAPRRLEVNIAAEPGRIHLSSVWESLAGQPADSELTANSQQNDQLIVPCSGRNEYRRSI
jgi:hypothetical protein